MHTCIFELGLVMIIEIIKKIVNVYLVNTCDKMMS